MRGITSTPPSYVLQPAAACILSLPVISKVRSAAGSAATTSLRPAPIWKSRDPISPELPASGSSGFQRQQRAHQSVQGTSVSINGKPGFVSYISPTQVNVQAPADTATGPVGITVTNCSGTSAPSNIDQVVGRARHAGTPDSISQSVLQRRRQAVPGSDLRRAGPLCRQATTADPRLVRSPRSPAIRSGSTGSASATCKAAHRSHRTGGTTLNAPVTISFGQTPATITYKGFYPSFVGLDLFIITVPNVPDGDYQINVTENGQPLQQPAAFLTVHK